MAIGFAIMGTGRIGRRVRDSLLGLEDAKLVAVATRDVNAGCQFVAGSGHEIFVGSYRGVLNHPVVEAVYIATPNDTHADLLRLALEAGKHVLCEKPLAIPEGELVQLLEESPSPLFAEAFPWRLDPRSELLQRLLTEGAIGRPAIVHSIFNGIGNAVVLGRARAEMLRSLDERS